MLEAVAPVRTGRRSRQGSILWALIVILLILWVLGFAVNVGGGLIHVLIVIALVVLIYNLLVGRRSM